MRCGKGAGAEQGCAPKSGRVQKRRWVQLRSGGSAGLAHQLSLWVKIKSFPGCETLSAMT